MKTKTVRLSDNYRFKNGVVEYFTCIKRGEYDYENENEISDDEWGYVATQYKIGAQAMLVSHTDVSPNACRRGTVDHFSLVFSTDGIGGNSNHNIKRYHGWRGTTNDISCYAHGLREIVKIRTLKNGQIAITVGPDICPNED